MLIDAARMLLQQVIHCLTSSRHSPIDWLKKIRPLVGWYGNVIGHIVVHEFCDMHVRDHSDAFWNEVDKVLPDYGERREWLRKFGAGLDI